MKQKSTIKQKSHYNVATLNAPFNDSTEHELSTHCISEIEPRHHFKSQGHYNKVKGQIKVKPHAFWDTKQAICSNPCQLLQGL